MVDVGCDICGKPVGLKPYRVRRTRHHYCSRQCAAAGDSLLKKGQHVTPAIERFLRRIEVAPNGCWQWNGACSDTGYAAFTKYMEGKVLDCSGHQWAYEYFVGPIPDGLQLDHLCRNRSCVNPDHLEVVTSAENTKRGIVARRLARELEGKE